MLSRRYFSLILSTLGVASAFLAPLRTPSSSFAIRMAEDADDVQAKKDAALEAAIAAMFGGDDGNQEAPEATKMRIETLINEHPILLFMKGSKVFPQCGFSDTATKILEKFTTDYHTVDVLDDEAIRQGIKNFSQWPTIPQLYIAGEFIGGSDIMLEMYESGEMESLIKETMRDK